jgi:hypothetical protein
VQLQVYDLVDGAVLPGKRPDSDNGVRVMSAPPKPEGASDSGGCLVLDNDRVSVEMDCLTGMVRAIVDKKARRRTLLREQVRLHEAPRSGAYLFRPNRLESTPRASGGRVTIALARGPLVQEVIVLADGLMHVTRLLCAHSSHCGLYRSRGNHAAIRHRHEDVGHVFYR